MISEKNKYKSIVRKPFINKRTKQMSISIPKKEMRKLNPSLKFSDDMFVKIKLVRRRK